MDPKEKVLETVRNVLGCKAVTSFAALGDMHQASVERHMDAARHRLSPANMVSIYCAWLQEQVCRDADLPPAAAVQRTSFYLAHRGCGRKLVSDVWHETAVNALLAWLRVMPSDKIRYVREAVRDLLESSYPQGVQADAAYASSSVGPEIASSPGSRDDDVQSTWAASSECALSDRVRDAAEGLSMLTSALTFDGKMDWDYDHDIGQGSGQFETRGNYSSRSPTRPRLAANSPGRADRFCSVCGAKNEHSSDGCPGKAFGYGPRAAPDSSLLQTDDGLHSSSVPPRGGGSPPPSFENRFGQSGRQSFHERGRRDSFTKPRAKGRDKGNARGQSNARQGDLFEGRAAGAHNTSHNHLSTRSPTDMTQDKGGADDEWTLKPVELMTPEEREALRQADAFLARLSDECAEGVAPPVKADNFRIPEMPKPKKNRQRIPMQGALVEPAKPKPKIQPAKSATEDPTMADAAPPGMPVKEATASGPNAASGAAAGTALQALFKNQDSAWVNPRKVKRKTALEMWDEVDAKKAAEGQMEE
ncbi:hypothetical protein HIM_00594 [Hirsutella minnesotensis 3608]|nr:hypothetical protein HIM_00594 [Hirsutella minnesotensis 3608]